LGKVKIIGITGDIGAGKTEVSRILEGLGAEVISADAMGRLAYAPGTEGWRRVVEEFGEEVLAPGGEVDRTKLGVTVFSDERRLRKLNAIVHPLIRSMVEKRLEELGDRGAPVAVVEVVLLLEAGWAGLVDEVWVVAADEDVAVARAAARSGLELEAIRARARAQMPQSERVARADVVVENNESLESLRVRVSELWKNRI
jgi:dephospho-CoA kinase